MRWCFVDRVESYLAWKSITARKAVSFEEFNLLKNQGREGEFPESLMLETCVEALRWLIIRSSEFQLSALLHSVESFSVKAPASCGDVLRMTATIESRAPRGILAQCEISSPRGLLARGKMTVETLPLDTSFERPLIQGMWKELYGEA